MINRIISIPEGQSPRNVCGFHDSIMDFCLSLTSASVGENTEALIEHQKQSKLVHAIINVLPLSPNSLLIILLCKLQNLGHKTLRILLSTPMSTAIDRRNLYCLIEFPCLLLRNFKEQTSHSAQTQ